MKRGRVVQKGPPAKRRRLAAEEVKRASEERHETIVSVLHEAAGFPLTLAKLTVEYDSCRGAAACFARPEYCEQWLPELLTEMQLLTVVWAGDVAHRIIEWQLTAGRYNKQAQQIIEESSLLVFPTEDASTFINDARVPIRKLFYFPLPAPTLSAAIAAQKFCALVDAWYDKGEWVEISLSFIADDSGAINSPVKLGETRADLRFEAYDKPAVRTGPLKSWPEAATKYKMLKFTTWTGIKGTTTLAAIQKPPAKESTLFHCFAI